MNVGEHRWKLTAPTFADYNYRQTWEFGLLSARRMGATSEHVEVRRDGEVIGLAAVRVRRVPMLGWGVAYISGGPLTRHHGEALAVDMSAFEQTMTALVAYYVHHRGLILRVMCPVADQAWTDLASAWLKARGFIDAMWPRRYRTIAVDTTKSMEQIRQQLSKNWRKNLVRGEQRGITLRVETSVEAFEPVCRLYRELLDRKGFEVEVDADFYATAQARLEGSDRFTVILAELDGQVVGMNVVSALGDTLAGIIGATTYEGARHYAAYLLEWEAIELAVRRGLMRYDMGGIDPVGNAGGYDFKRGTRGVELTAAGPLEARPLGARATLGHWCEQAYRSARRRLRAKPKRADGRSKEADSPKPSRNFHDTSSAVSGPSAGSNVEASITA